MQTVASVPACLPVLDAATGTISAYALVDQADAEMCTARRWVLDARGYAQEADGGLKLHRLIADVVNGTGLHVHHVNGERLDDRRANLRVLTPDEHSVAHGHRRRSPDVLPPAHPAEARGHRRWLADRSRTGTEQAARIVASVARPSHLPKTLTTDEAAALLRVPNRRAPTGLRNLAMLTVMYRAGLRVSEACGLHLRDVRWQDGQLHLRSEVAKGGREAYVYLDQPTLDVLERWVAVRREYAAGKPHLFTTLGGGPVSRHYVWEMVRRYARRAGLEHLQVHPHTLRHSYATELLREGFNIVEVQHLLRHADIRTTVIYTHITDVELQRKVRERGA